MFEFPQEKFLIAPTTFIFIHNRPFKIVDYLLRKICKILDI